jgi:hypothetical protein
MTIETPAAIVDAVRALVEFEDSIADYVALAREAAPSPRRLAAVRARLVDEGRRARRDVRAMVRDYTAALRARGVPPEQMVIGIKSLTTRALGRARSPQASALRADIVLWAIESYYDDTHSGGVSGR